MSIPLRTIHQLMRRQAPESIFEIIPGLDPETKEKLIQAVKRDPVAEKEQAAATKEKGK